MAIKKFRPYVELMPFTVITDHASLKWLMGLKDLSGRLARWSLQLQAYNFEIMHRKGSENVVADMLSRSPINITVNELELGQMLEKESEEFRSGEYVDLIEHIKENADQLPDLKVENSLVFKKIYFDRNADESIVWKLWVPSTLTHNLITKAHCENVSAHGGVNKTLEKLRRFYYWPRMAIQVKEFVKSCQVCQETKPANQHLMPSIGQEVVTERPFQKLYIDFLGKYPRSKAGNSYIFIVVDHFSKFTFLKAMRDATTQNVIKFLVQEVFHKFGVPKIIHSDNGSQFISKSFANMIEAYKIKHLRTAVYAPQSNASERVNQSVLAAIRAYLEEDHRDWDLYLSEIECALRNSVHSATGVTPFFSLFGYHMYTNGDDYKLAKKLKSLSDHEINSLGNSDKLAIIRDKIRKNMHDAYTRSAARYNRRARNLKLIPGQEVYRRNMIVSDFGKNRNAKFCRKFLKCRVIRPVGANMYELEDLQGKPIGVFHAKDIKT